MKAIRLSLSRAEATKELRASLRKISNTALRHTDEGGCYGDIEEGPEETKFTVGLGPTSFTTAKGSIVDTGPASSVILYSFEGPFWAIFKRMLINAHFQSVFREHRTKAL